MSQTWCIFQKVVKFVLKPPHEMWTLCDECRAVWKHARIFGVPVSNHSAFVFFTRVVFLWSCVFEACAISLTESYRELCVADYVHGLCANYLWKYLSSTKFEKVFPIPALHHRQLPPPGFYCILPHVLQQILSSYPQTPVIHQSKYECLFFVHISFVLYSLCQCVWFFFATDIHRFLVSPWQKD